MADDSENLRTFAETGSDLAFRAIVDRHLPAVLAIAYRRCGNHSLAEEAAQKVFTDLARNASRLARHPTLAGWLFLSARYAASSLARAEARRNAALEGAALSMNTGNEESIAEDQADWRPLLDEAIERLGNKDRDALLLRFFDNQSYLAIGEVLGTGEGGARMRVTRAIEKLRSDLGRRSVTATAAALAGTLATHAGTSPPPGLAAAITTQAIAAGPTAPILLALAMTTPKVKIAVALAAAAFAFSGYEIRQRFVSLETENLQLSQQVAQSAHEIAHLHLSLSELRGAATPVPATTRSQSPQETRAKSLAELAKLYPQYREAFVRRLRRNTYKIYGPAVAGLHLSPDVMEKVFRLLEENGAAQMDANEEAQAQGLTLGSSAYTAAVMAAGTPSANELRELIGIPALQQLQLSAQQVRQTSQLQIQTEGYAADMTAAGAALTPAQSEALAATIQGLTPPGTMSAYTQIDPSSNLRPIDSDLLQKALPILSPSQLAILHEDMTSENQLVAFMRSTGESLPAR